VNNVLKARYKADINLAIARAQVGRELRTVIASDGAEVYAYPHREGIAWGVNTAGSVNILRGIRRPDGTDKAAS
jgi:lipid-binding SYLF domain-containing protein